MKSSTQILIFLSMAVILAMLSSMVTPPPAAQAQGTPRPTPANESPGNDGDRDDDDDDDDGRGGGQQAGPSYGEIVGGANVSGIVYNYTTGSPQSGVTVRIEGNNWEAETVTDLNGMYQFGGLSFGEGQLSLVLPFGATQAAPAWPVPLTSGDHKVNLGYYVGDYNPLPVRVSAQVKDEILRVQIANQAVAGGASNAHLEIQLPMNLEATTTMHSSRGVVEYGLHTPQIHVARLAGGEQVEVVIPLRRSAMGDRSARAYQYTPMSAQRQRAERVVVVNQAPGRQSEIIQLKFTYDQQFTPQIIHLDPFAPTPSTEIQGLRGSLPQAEPAALIEPANPPASLPENRTSESSPASEITTEGAAMAEEAADTSSEPVTAEPAAAFIPAAGGVMSHSSTTPFFMSLVVGLGLLIGGCWSLRTPRTEQHGIWERG